jgi:uncharacterized protein
MPGETLITVRGEAHADAEPEIAILEVTVAARDRDRVRAVELLVARTRDLGDLFKEAGTGIARLASRRVQVQPLFKDAKVRTAAAGFLARGGFSVTFADFSLLGELVAVLAAEDLVTLSGPSWELRPDSPVYREVRVAAAKDSLARARDYAEAFGGRIVGLAEAADSGLLSSRSGDSRVMSAGSAGRMRPREAAGDAAEIELIPAVQTVYACVEARYLMTSPVLTA